VKSVLGEFSSGVSIRPNKGLQVRLAWGPLFIVALAVGGYGGPSSGSETICWLELQERILGNRAFVHHRF